VGTVSIEKQNQQQKPKQKYEVEAVLLGATGVVFHLARDLPRSGSKVRRLDDA
jgi:hypothetical protein